MVLKKILLVASFLLLLLVVKANNVYFKHLSVQNGLSQINILSIYQDETGALWFGTYEGLNRYNGQTFTSFHPSQDGNNLTQNEIMTICGNQKGTIYIQALHDLIAYDIRKQKFHCILPDKVFNITHHNDTLWIVTGKDLLYRADNDTTIKPFAKFQNEIKGYAPICIANDGFIYVGLPDGLLQLASSDPKNQKRLLPGIKIKCLYQDSQNNLWAGSGKNGLYLRKPNGTIQNFTNQPNNSNSISNNDVRCIIEDDFNNIWIGTFLGVNKYMPDKNKWENHIHQNHVSYSLSHSSVFALHKDSQGGIWIGTYYGGINYFNPASNYSDFYEANPDDPQALSCPFVGKMQEDKDHNLWICTEGGGLNYFDRQTKKFIRYTQQNNSPGIGHNNLKSIWFHKQTEKLYIGTHTGGISVFDTRKRTSHTLKNIPGNPYSLPSDVVNDMQYYKGRLAISTQAGISAMNLETEHFEPLTSNPATRKILENYIYETFHIAQNNLIWLSNGNGGVAKVNLNSGEMKQYYHDTNESNTIGKFKIIHILENGKGELFFSTAGSGLFKYQPQTDSFICFSKENNLLMSNYCYYAAESPSGDLIVLHNQGVSYVNTEKRKLTYTYKIPQMSFCQGSSIYCTQDGELFLGGTNGIISLSDKQEPTFLKNHRFYFDQLIINNQVIQPDDDSHILSQTMPYTEKIHLKHDQNSLILELATSNYIQNKYRYEFQLQGFNQTWIPLYASQIVYTNLDPGKYKLVVREISNTQTVCGKIALDIIIHPPFYANLYAYCLYFLIVILVLYIIIRFNNRQAKLKASLEFERKEKERIEELNQTKLRFFTNISHEFRTPLTLIIGQIESLLQLNKFPPNIYNRMLRVYKNANHMRSLISELLDFRKQEQGYLKLKTEYRDIIAFTKELFMSFYEYALKNHIHYKFESDEHASYLWFDPKQMQKVILNLLSNAFKYTNAEGTITVIMSLQEQHIIIKIKDSGIGIPAESINKIFDRFYQTDNQDSKLSLGTGIGLALTKSIVELHKGSIHVESTLNEGSCFTIKLLTGKEHFSAEELQADNATTCITDVTLIPLDVPFCGEDMEETIAPVQNRPSILIVEDNLEISDMLKEIFCPIYDVFTAKDGKEGLDQAYQIQPDIILSDVMMPEMSGKEMCYKIKNSIDLSHIPVVLLTAQTSIEFTIEGYMYGADDYITKPFNVKLLISRCNNLVKNRKALIEKFRNQQDVRISGSAINQADQELIDKATLIIRNNFENPTFNMDGLASELAIGRNKLYARIKELTGLTPNEFALKLKLNESMMLLNKHPELNISEISDRLGFSSTQYFSKCFKSVYGVSPLTYRKNNN